MTHTTYSSTKSMLIVGSIVALSMIAFTNPAAAYGNHYPQPQSNDITVNNNNSAYVSNTVSVNSNTGGNSVVGGNTGGAGNGGDARGSHATAGNGGTSGGSNNDGLIQTGDAAALSSITNKINTNRTSITTDCGCQGRTGGDVNVNNTSKAKVGNTVAVNANTGYNGVAGGTSGVAGNGGEASAHSWSLWKHQMAGHGASATAGNGGNTGSSNNLGTIVTGDALSDSVVVNVVNRNITRVQ